MCVSVCVFMQLVLGGVERRSLYLTRHLQDVKKNKKKTEGAVMLHNIRKGEEKGIFYTTSGSSLDQPVKSLKSLPCTTMFIQLLLKCMRT